MEQEKIHDSGLMDFFKDLICLRTVLAKILVNLLIVLLVMFIFIYYNAGKSIMDLEISLIEQRLISDINYIEDLINPTKTGGTWNVRGNTLYFGDIPLGDGTEEKAYLKPFLDHEQKTGTFSYVFLRKDDAPLRYIKTEGTGEDYQEGYYYRIAGSTRGPDGQSIVGTYITKNVSEALDEYGTYSGEANVAGGKIFCRYNALRDKNRNIIGAIVVGRNVTELEQNVEITVNSYLRILLVILLFGVGILFFLAKKWMASIKLIKEYLKQIEEGNIPENELVLNTKDEMSIIAESINKMTTSLQENVILRKKSETDALTGLPNRFAYEHYAKYIYDNMLKYPRTFAVAILDIDYFKQYNDTYGHQKGDACIRMIAEEINTFMKEYDNIFGFRYGGDEFVVMYTGYSKEQIEIFAKKLRVNIFSKKLEHKCSKCAKYVTITQGICFDTFEPNDSIAEFFKRADEALYNVKRDSRNNYKIVSLQGDER